LPARRFVLDHPNAAIIAVVSLLLLNSCIGAWSFYKVHTEQNQLQSQQLQFKQNQLQVDFKICDSLNKGKLDRVSDYQFTIKRTEAFFKNLPHTAKNEKNLRITRRFYHGLIRHTLNQIIKCPKV